MKKSPKKYTILNGELMTIEQAVKLFGIDEKEIRKRKKDEMIIGCRTVKRKIVIPDDTKIIPSKSDIQSFLFEILKYKNNSHVVISRKLCPDDERLAVILEYVYRRGFIGEYIFDNDIKRVFSDIYLTEEGLNYVIGNGRINRINQFEIAPISINPEIKIGIINI